MNYKGITLILTAAMVISGGNYVLVKGSTLDSGKNNSGYEIKVNNSESLSSLGEYKDINLESSNASNITYDLEKYKNLDEGTIVVRFNSKDSKIQSLLGISNSKTKNGYFNFYVTNSRVGFELRNQKNEGNTQSGTENLVHMYKDVALNDGDNTVALKIEKNKGYKLFLNGKMIKEVKDTNTKFLNNIENLDSAFIGKTNRYGQSNQYNFKGNIGFMNIYNEPLGDDYLLSKTGETKAKEEVLVDGAVKTDPVDLFHPGFLNSSNYRIPALFKTKEGTLIASIDARRHGGADAPNNDIDTAVRRSEDGGKTWDEGQ